MEKIFTQMPLSNALMIISLAACMAVTNYRNENINVIVFLAMTLSMITWPNTTSQFLFGFDPQFWFQKFLAFVFSSIIILQHNAYRVIRDLTVGLFSVGYRAIDLLVNSLRSLV